MLVLELYMAVEQYLRFRRMAAEAGTRPCYTAFTGGADEVITSRPGDIRRWREPLRNSLA